MVISFVGRQRGVLRLNCATSRIKIQSSLSILAALWLFSLYGMDGVADPQATPSSALEEVIVTATKRSQAVEEVPQSIAVVSGVALAQQQAQRFSDYLNAVAGVSTLNLYGGEGTNIVIRGLSTAPDGETNGSATSTYFGESFLGGSLPLGEGTPNLRPVDLARLEVLRGPQGTLYGAGSLAGTVRLIPNNPRFDIVEGDVSLSGYHKESANQAGYSASAVLNLPLVSNTLAVRFVAYDEREPGFIYSIREKSVIGTGKVSGGRAAVAFKPNDVVDFQIFYAHQKRDTDGSNYYDPLLPLYETSRYPERYERTTDLLSAVMNLQIGVGTLTSVTTYLDDHLANRQDGSGSLGFSQLTSPSTRRTAEEIRLASPEDRRIRWIGGIYVDSESGHVTTEQFDLVTGARPQFIGSGLLQDQTLTQRAFFGEIAFDITRAFTATLGARYAAYNGTANSYEVGVDPANPQSLLPTTDPSTVRDYFRPKDSTFNPRLNVTYKPDSDSLYYAEISKGFRAGGVYQRLGPDCQLHDSVSPVFKSDTTRNYEIGAKLSTLQKRLVVNASLFRVDWKDVPVFLGDPSCPPGEVKFYVQNAAGARSQGVELELIAQLLSGLRADLTLAEIETKLTSVQGALGAGAPGEELVGNPKLTANLALDYEKPLTSRVNGFLGMNVNYVGKYKNGLSCDFNGFVQFYTRPGDIALEPGLHGCYPALPGSTEFAVDPRSGGYAAVNAQIGVDWDRVRAYVFARNLFDTNRRTLIDYFATDGHINYTRVEPRTVGMSLEYHF